MDQEIQIGLDMIPMFKRTEEEAQLEYNKIMEVSKELDKIRDDNKIERPRYIQPLARTSFMVRKSTQGDKSALRKLPQEGLFKKFQPQKKD